MRQPLARSYVYVLGCAHGGPTYIGWTSDPDRRLQQHNQGKGARFTRGRQWLLLYVECHDSRSAAMRREIQLKKDRKFRAGFSICP